MGVIAYTFNLNISPKMSYGVLEWYYVTELHAYDFVIKIFVINKGCYLCQTLYIIPFISDNDSEVNFLLEGEEY